MDETTECQRIRPLLAELATGAATGHDRAAALRHVAGCPSCRAELSELARSADDLLLLARAQEPPPGFETAVMERILSLSNPPRRPALIQRIRARLARRAVTTQRRPIAARLAGALTALALAVSAGAAVAYWQGAPDRHLADRYRQATAAGATHPTAAPVTTADGKVVGRVYLYRGSPSWAMVSLTAAPAPGAYAMSVLSTAGTRYVLGVCTVTGTAGLTGYPLPVPVTQIASVELTNSGIRLSAHPA